MKTQSRKPHAIASAGPVVRIEVAPKQSARDARVATLLRESASIGLPLTGASCRTVYLLEAADAPLTGQAVNRITTALLTDPVTEVANTGAAPTAAQALLEIHPQPGVMDPVARSVESAIFDLLGIRVRASTGVRWDLDGQPPKSALQIARRLLANPVIHDVHDTPHHPDRFPTPRTHEHALTHIKIRDLDNDALERMSRDAHLFLSLDEMRAIQSHFRTLDREPTDIELETLAQTWSEHCVHKTLKSAIHYTSDEEHDPVRSAAREGIRIDPDGSVHIDNLLKRTVAQATFDLIDDGLDWTLSVFVDNAGIIKFDDNCAVCVKVETHNHPSAIEPYGGAATGIGGCIRDIIGTGLAARPIASTDVFCVAPQDMTDIPAGCHHPARILSEVVGGVRDYGNRMGIPTVNGAVFFDERFVGNPLVFCGCIGVLPTDKIAGDAQPGDLIIALGGRTGRDGIHGATFSSAELTDTHADEFAHAVQIGNPIEEKRVLDAILKLRDAPGGPLFSAITDCGAGGFSSAVGEMAEKIGAEVELDRAPLKYDGLSYTEIWISEAQERMVIAAPRTHLKHIEQICAAESVELAVLGTFGTPQRELVLRYHGSEVGRMPMSFIHDGIPQPTRRATWTAPTLPAPMKPADTAIDLTKTLHDLLAHPNIASKHGIIRQYDYEVKAGTIIKPLVGPGGRGPGDAAVIKPSATSRKGLAIASGLQIPLGDPRCAGDPYQMALAGIDECMRNLVCVGADPAQVAILDNFCWPGVKDEASMGALVRCAAACYDGAMAYRTPFVSGKDSLNNQFTTDDGTTIKIPPTLLVTGIGIVPDATQCVTSDAKRAGNTLILVGTTDSRMGGSHAQRLGLPIADPRIPTVDLDTGPRVAAAVHQLIRAGLVASAHDCSEGGLFVAITEMLIAGSSESQPLGASIALTQVHSDPFIAAFAESPSRYVLELTGPPESTSKLLGKVPHVVLGRLDDSGRLRVPAATLDCVVYDLAAMWTNGLREHGARV